jgi:hypothetical protein
MADFLFSPEEYESEREYQHACEKFFELMQNKEAAEIPLLNEEDKTHEK